MRPADFDLKQRIAWHMCHVSAYNGIARRCEEELSVLPWWAWPRKRRLKRRLFWCREGARVELDQITKYELLLRRQASLFESER